MTRIKVSATEHARMTPARLVDIRDQVTARYKRDKKIRDKVGGLKQRDWTKVTGITLHQTAVEMTPTPERWESLGAHIGITRLSEVYWCYDFDRIVWHGNGWNNRCVGIEIDGRFPGLVGEDWTLWKGPESELTDEQVESAQQAIRWVCKFIELRGGKVEYLVAHRQSSMTRRADPGEAIWKRVALPMHEELGLSDGGPGFTIKGRPIPEGWNPAYTDVMY